MIRFTYMLFCCSVAQLCWTVCDPMYCSMPGFPVLHHLPEIAQIYVHWVGNAIQPSYLLSCILSKTPAQHHSMNLFSFLQLCAFHKFASHNTGSACLKWTSHLTHCESPLPFINKTTYSCFIFLMTQLTRSKNNLTIIFDASSLV